MTEDEKLQAACLFLKSVNRPPMSALVPMLVRVAAKLTFAVLMIVCAVLIRMRVFVGRFAVGMVMLVAVLVFVLVFMFMLVGMSMRFLAMGMLMDVNMNVPVFVAVGMFVSAFHRTAPFITSGDKPAPA